MSLAFKNWIYDQQLKEWNSPTLTGEEECEGGYINYMEEEIHPHQAIHQVVSITRKDKTC